MKLRFWTLELGSRVSFLMPSEEEVIRISNLILYKWKEGNCTIYDTRKRKPCLLLQKLIRLKLDNNLSFQKSE